MSHAAKLPYRIATWLHTPVATSTLYKVVWTLLLATTQDRITIGRTIFASLLVLAKRSCLQYLEAIELCLAAFGQHLRHAAHVRNARVASRDAVVGARPPRHARHRAAQRRRGWVRVVRLEGGRHRPADRRQEGRRGEAVEARSRHVRVGARLSVPE